MKRSEWIYWRERAALLDPKAYVLRSKADLGAAFYEVVPGGEIWYVVNAFYCTLNSVTTSFWNQRSPDVEVATPLTAGTRIGFSTESPYSMYYVCVPSLVWNTDPRYTDDPKGLYYQRLYKLRNLATFTLANVVPAGTANGTMADVYFPNDFASALMTSYSNSDASWGGLAGNSGALNCESEISDDHQNRIGRRTLFPFSRAVFDKLRVRGANAAGNNGAYMAGNVQITYIKLPSDW